MQVCTFRLYAGRKIDAKGIKGTQRDTGGGSAICRDSYLRRELNSMIVDSDRDNNYFLLPEEEGWSRE